MMLKSKLIFVSAFILSIQIINSARNRETAPKYVVRPNGINCEADNQTVLMKYCFLKPISRYIVTASMGFKYLIPLKKPIYVQMLMLYRYGTIFRQIIDTKQNEWCGFMEGAETFPLIRMMTGHLNSTVPQLIHKCPYEGELDLFNFTLSNGSPPESQIFPQGYYKLVVIVFKNNRTIVTVKIKGEITSDLKETFG